MIVELAAVVPRVRIASKKLRAWAADVEADLGGGGDVGEFGLERIRSDDDPAVVAGLDPAVFADKAHRAGAQLGDPAGAFAEGCLQEVEDDLDAVGVTGGDALFGRLVLDGHGVVGPLGLLAEVERVRGPVEQSSAGVEVPVASPSALNILLVVRPPRGGAEPTVPVDNILGRRGLAGEPGVIKCWDVD